MIKDPVCGMEIDESQAPATATHDSRAYHFCSESCKEKFLQDPGHYAGADPSGHH